MLEPTRLINFVNRFLEDFGIDVTILNCEIPKTEFKLRPEEAKLSSIQLGLTGVAATITRLYFHLYTYI